MALFHDTVQRHDVGVSGSESMECDLTNMELTLAHGGGGARLLVLVLLWLLWLL